MLENRPYFEPKSGTSGNEIADIVAEFALCMKRGDSPDSPAAQSAVERWRACCTNGGSDFHVPPFDAENYGSATTDYMNDAFDFYKKGH